MRRKLRLNQNILMHEDRLLRFGVGLIRYICRHTGTEFHVVHAAEPVSFEAELGKDVVTLMTVNEMVSSQGASNTGDHL